MINFKIDPNYQRKNILFGIIFLLVAIILMASGCSHTEKVLVPPRVDLNAYNLIGVIEFSTNAENTLKSYLTQNYIENIQNAQPGILVFELGDKDQLLRSLGYSELNLESIRSISQKYNVDALILGHFEVSEVIPKVKVHTASKSVNARAYIEASLRTRILETDNGATFWTRITSGKSQVAKISLIDGEVFGFGVSDPKEKYGKLVPELVYANTLDFRSYYEYRTVK